MINSEKSLHLILPVPLPLKMVELKEIKLRFYDSVNHLKSTQYMTDEFGHLDYYGLFLIVLQVTIKGIIPDSLPDFKLALYELPESNTRTMLSFCDFFP